MNKASILPAESFCASRARLLTVPFCTVCVIRRETVAYWNRPAANGKLVRLKKKFSNTHKTPRPVYVLFYESPTPNLIDMWHPFLILLCHITPSTVFADTSAQLLNGTGPSELSAVNTHQPLSKIEPDASATLIQTVNDPSMIPKEFSTQFRQNQSRPISETSTYMTALLAMIAISPENFLSGYAGGEYAYKGFADVRINIWSANSPTDPLQPRHAIYGLQVAIYSIATMDAWYETTITLCWTRAGISFPVGYIHIEQGVDGNNSTPGPANTTQGSGTQPYVVRPRNSSDPIEQETDASENGRISISPTFGGEILTLKEIFLTLMSAVAIIAQHAVAQLVEPFDIRDENTDCEFEYQAIVPPRTQAPFFQYNVAAVALRILAKAMVQAWNLEDVEFTVKVDNIPVGIGFLKIPERLSATLVGTS